MADEVREGTVHRLPDDLRAAIVADAALVKLWQKLTPLGRNEFICWVGDAKRAATRSKRIQRTGEALIEGKTRPCCWAGCIHRTDAKYLERAPSAWQQAVLTDKRRR